MKISKNIRYNYRIRDYETAHVEIGAVADHHDLGWSDEDWTELPPQQRATLTDQLELLVIYEVDKLTREEVQSLSQFSEINPNLAEDFLSTPPAIDPRSQHARSTEKKADHPSTSSRRIRRPERGTGTPSPPAA